jgi:hypothetical protein
MSKIAILLLTAAAAFAADDAWTKVKQLKSGTEIRVVKKGSMQPVVGKIDEANDENLILVVKNEQIAVPKDQIDRLDARPAERSRYVKESKTTTNEGNPAHEPKAGMNGMDTGAGSGYSSSTSVAIQGKGDFETVYRRPSPAPKK